jgi:hypothetical protein
MSDWLETLWGDLLSEEPDRVVAAFVTLPADEQTAILAHLGRMVSEDGWAEVQRQSAGAALRAITDADAAPLDDDDSDE